MPAAELSGWYAYLSWFPTGDRRRYRPARGVFGAVRPKHDYGALELALRYSFLDLQDRAVGGDRGSIVTLGVNWYLNRSIRLMADYSGLEAERRFGDARPNVFQMRLQLTFR